MRTISAMSLAAVLALPLVSALARADDQDSYIREPVRLEQRFDRMFEGNCKYTLEVTGTITPVTGQENEKAPQVTPNVAVSAQAACPNEEAVKVSENILGTGPLTWRQLQDSLAQHAQVVTVEKQHECTYAPKFRVAASNVDIVSFDHHCRAI